MRNPLAPFQIGRTSEPPFWCRHEEWEETERRGEESTIKNHQGGDQSGSKERVKRDVYCDILS